MRGATLRSGTYGDELNIVCGDSGQQRERMTCRRAFSQEASGIWRASEGEYTKPSKRL